MTSEGTTAGSIADEKHVSLTTYRKSGETVSTPVWVVGLDDGRVGFWTAMGTGKTKRLKNDPRVAVRPSDSRGRVKDGTASYSGTGEMVQSGRSFEEVQGKVRAKYGFMVTVTRLLARLGPQGRQGLTYADTVVLITFDPVTG